MIGMKIRGLILSIWCIGAMVGLVSAHPDSHRIRRGDTLWSIAAAHGVSYQYLACLNGIRDPKQLRVGQRLILPHRPNGSMQLAFVWPLKTGTVTARFGPRRGHCHAGIDIAAPVGTPVRAAAGGRVVFSGRRRGYGDMIIIQHNDVYKTAYAHLHTRAVHTGQRVQRDTVMGTVGRSGRATGPHLHFEVRVRDHKLDPIFYLPRPPKWLRWR